MTRFWRKAYQICRWLALPGVCWAGFEIFGLTLRGEQMLFFTVAHTLPFVLLVLFVAVLGVAGWFCLAVLALARTTVRQSLGWSTADASLVVLGLACFVAAFETYERWARNDLSRWIVCLLGIACLFGLIWKSRLGPIRATLLTTKE